MGGYQNLSLCIQVEGWGYEYLSSKEKVKTLENLGGGSGASLSCKGSSSCGGLNNFFVSLLKITKA